MGVRVQNIAFFLLLVSMQAYAQTACPQGVAPGSPQCGPSGGNGAVMSPKKPTAHWKLTWGALVRDHSKGIVGTSTDQNSKRKARRAATEKCQSMGGGNCEIWLEYHHQCAVIAEPIEDVEPIWTIAQNGPSIELATDIGLEKCSKANGGHDCKIVYSNCTKPYLVYD